MGQIEILDDQAMQSLKEKIAGGDEKAFRVLFDHFSARLTSFAYAMLKANDAATEVVDEVFVQIWKKRRQITTIQNLRVYLYTATKNISLNYISRKAKEQLVEPFDYINIQLNDTESPEQKMITSEVLKKIRSAIDELPPRCKMIFKLVREDGLKYREVAGILNISVNTVDAQMVIAVKKISEKLRTDFGWPVPEPSSKKI
jgi:RNA polymerase sigma-70 factor (family 1)